MTKAIAFTVYPVSDLQRAIAFYQTVLELNAPDILNERWAEFDINGGTFAVATGGETIGMPAGSAFAVGFEVAELEPVRARIQEQGTEAGEPFEAPNCLSFFAKDPDGNRFAVHKHK